MVTGVWGKKISESTTPVGAPMAFASFIIFGATFLGLRLKIQMMRQMFDVFLDYHSHKVAMGRQAQQAMRDRHAGAGATRSEQRRKTSEWEEVRSFAQTNRYDTQRRAYRCACRSRRLTVEQAARDSGPRRGSASCTLYNTIA